MSEMDELQVGAGTPDVNRSLSVYLPPTAKYLKRLLDELEPGTLLTSAELAAVCYQNPMRANGGYGGQIARLASIYLPTYTTKVKARRYWSGPVTIRDLNSKLEASCRRTSTR